MESYTADLEIQTKNVKKYLMHNCLASTMARSGMEFDNRKLAAWIVACCCCTPGLAQSAAWNGTWALESTSQGSKPTMSFIQRPDGTDELVSSTFVDRFRCDGKAYPVLNRTGLKGTSEMTCNSLSNSSLDAVFRHSDRGPTLAHLQVSGDGKTLSETLETVDVSGKKKVETLNFVRISGKDGLVGDWKDTAPDPSRVIRFTLSGQAITFETPFAHSAVTLMLSGEEAHRTKDGVSGKTTDALQVDTPERFRITTRYDGVVVAQAIFSLSSDGNKIDEAFWLQQHPEEIARNTYHRSH